MIFIKLDYVDETYFVTIIKLKHYEELNRALRAKIFTSSIGGTIHNQILIEKDYPQPDSEGYFAFSTRCLFFRLTSASKLYITVTYQSNRYNENPPKIFNSIKYCL